jgi:hypothetical protein
MACAVLQGYAVVVQGMADMLTYNCYHVTVANCMSFAHASVPETASL